MHGIFEEGIALWTFFFKHPNLSASYPLGTAYGIHLNWAVLCMVGEAFILVVLGILFARIVFPYEKRGRPLLSKKGTFFAISAIVVLSGFYNLIVLKFLET